MRTLSFWRREHGTSYSLSAVLVLPLFLLFVLLVIDLCYLMVARFGTQMAALDAARTAATSEGLVPASTVESQANQSARLVLAGFVGNSNEELRTSTTFDFDASQEARDYASAVTRESGLYGNEELFARRHRAAASRVRVTLVADQLTVRATVHYRARLISPLASRFLIGSESGDFPLQASVTLQRELPGGMALGIDYDPVTVPKESNR